MNARFGDNVQRLMGMHRIQAQEAPRLFGVTPAAVSEWKHDKRSPRLGTAFRVAEFFEVSGDELVQADFEQLLSHGAGDPERFKRVESKLNLARRSKQAPRA